MAPKTNGNGHSPQVSEKKRTVRPTEEEKQKDRNTHFLLSAWRSFLQIRKKRLPPA